MKESSRTPEDILEAWSELTFSGCFFISLPISTSPFIYVIPPPPPSLSIFHPPSSSNSHHGMMI